MQDANWDDLRFVLAVLRERSFAGAARALSVDQTTVSRRIAALEERLGTVLFERAAGVLNPTRAGMDIRHHAQAIESAYNSACESAGGSDASIAGTVRVTAVPWLANQVLVPGLPRFLAGHPGLALEILAEAADLSLLRRETDIALRLARPRQEGRAIARKIATVRYGVYQAREPLGEDLPWIGYVETLDSLPQARWIADRAKKEGSAISSLRVNDAETLVASLRTGLGRSYLPCAIGDHDPALQRLDRDQAEHHRELWMIVHPDQRNLARVRVTCDWLASSLRDRLGQGWPPDPS